MSSSTTSSSCRASHQTLVRTLARMRFRRRHRELPRPDRDPAARRCAGSRWSSGKSVDRSPARRRRGADALRAAIGGTARWSTATAFREFATTLACTIFARPGDRVIQPVTLDRGWSKPFVARMKSGAVHSSRPRRGLLQRWIILRRRCGVDQYSVVAHFVRFVSLCVPCPSAFGRWSLDNARLPARLALWPTKSHVLRLWRRGCGSQREWRNASASSTWLIDFIAIYTRQATRMA